MPGSGTEGLDPAYADLDSWPTPRLVEALARTGEEASRALLACRDALARAIDLAASRLQTGGRLLYLGAGTSGRLGVLDASELPPTYAWPPERAIALIAGGDAAIRVAQEGAEDDGEAGARALSGLAAGASDVVIGIAASGQTPYVIGAIEFARRVGALTIGIANNPGSRLLAAAEVAIALDTGPELVAGSTRMKAGTAQKLALNAISTGVMIRLGKVHGNLMVDLKATNSKLRDRAIRIVRQISGAGADEARRALEGAGWEVRTALVSIGAGVDAAAARTRLERSHGSVRGAVGAGEVRGPDIVLGVDGGQGDCTLQASDLQGGVLATVRAPAIITMADPRGPDLLERALRQGMDELTRKLGGRPRVAAAYLALSGVSANSPEEAAVVEVARRELGTGLVGLGEDIEALLAAAFPEGPGVVVYAGTGSSAIGRDARGRRIRQGGLGPLLGDEGSATWIGREVVRRVFRDPPGRAGAGLVRVLEEGLGGSDWAAVRTRVYSAGGRTALAALAPLVAAEAARGDERAVALLAEAGAALAALGLAALARTGRDSTPALVYAGGVFNAGPAVLEPFTADLRRGAPGVEVRPLAADPVTGAVALALNLLARRQ